MRCPCCNSEMNNFATFPYMDFDGSMFNQEGILFECEHCQLVSVKRKFTDSQITEHYANECLYSEQSGVGVGGSSREDLERYRYYHRLLADNKLFVDSVVDVGCSRGGWLNYLHSIYDEKIKLSGIDVDTRSIDQAQGGSIEYSNGDMFNLPFDDSSKSLLCYFHVLEHVIDIHKVVIELARVMSDAGAAIIEVPDALQYCHNDARVGTLFWMAMKEHINHFATQSLYQLLKQHGLHVTAVYHSLLPMKNDKKYPSLSLIVKKTEETSPDVFLEYKQDRISTMFHKEYERLIGQIEGMVSFIDDSGSVSFWGIGLEFLLLYPHIRQHVEVKNIILIDINKAKQGLSIDGIQIVDPSQATTNGVLICCSFMSNPSIKKAAIDLGWEAEQLYFFE